MNLEKYQKASEKYKPDEINILFIAESPPSRDKMGELRYFYFDDIYKGDVLLRSIMDSLFPDIYERYKVDKRYLLKTLTKHGIFLIDACEYPIDKESNKDRDYLIEKEHQHLISRLKKLADTKTKIILIKKNVYNILFERLRNEGYNVINTEHLDFPSHGNQKKFKEKLRKLSII